MSDRLVKVLIVILTALALASVTMTIQTLADNGEVLPFVCTTQKGTWVNLRTEPYKDADICGRMRHGWEFHGVKEGSWIHWWDKDGKLVYAQARYFETPYRARMRVTQKVNKRASPNGEVLGQLKKGEWIDIFAITWDEEGREWARSYGNVFIQRQYLKPIQSQQTN